MFGSLHSAQYLGEEDGQGRNIPNHLTNITVPNQLEYWASMVAGEWDELRINTRLANYKVTSVDYRVRVD